MATFNSIEDFFKQLDNHIPDTLKNIAKEIQEDMRFFWLQSIYANKGSYYKYTNDLLESTKVSEPYKVGDEWRIYIYISEEDHTNKAWYNLSELGISKGENVPITLVAERMQLIGRSGNIMDEANKKWLANGKAMQDIINRLKQKYDIIA